MSERFYEIVSGAGRLEKAVRCDDFDEAMEEFARAVDRDPYASVYSMSEVGNTNLRFEVTDALRPLVRLTRFARKVVG